MEGGAGEAMIVEGTREQQQLLRERRAAPDRLFQLGQMSDIARLEAYRGKAEAPPEYEAECGVVVIWTKRGGPAGSSRNSERPV